MTTPTQGEHAQTELAHELFAAAQLAPGEGIEDAVSRIAAALTAAPAQPAAPQGVAYAELPEPDATTVGLGAVWSRHSMRDFADRTHALRASNGQAPAGAVAPDDRVPEAWTNLLAYVLQDDMHNRLTPRVIDIAYTAFMQAKKANDEDGGASDWFNDTRPMVRGLIEQLKKDLIKELAAAHPTPTAQAAPAADYDHGPQSLTVAEAARHVGKWLNDRPNHPLDLRDVAMLCAHAQKAPAAGAVAGPVVRVGNQEFGIADTGKHFTAQDMAFAAGQAFDEGLSAAPTPATTTDSVLEDAARWQYLRDVREVALCVMFFGNGCTNITMADVIKAIDAKIAARKQGAKHD